MTWMDMPRLAPMGRILSMRVVSVGGRIADSRLVVCLIRFNYELQSNKKKRILSHNS